MSITTTAGSTAFAKIHSVLQKYDWYQDYLQETINRNEYLKILLKFKQELMDSGLNEDQIHLSSRFSLNSEKTVDLILSDLQSKHVLASTDYPKEKFNALYQHISQYFMHASYTTYIFPEEARLLYALTYLMCPKTMVFLGSYYGYWAIWAAAVLMETGGQAYLIDIDTKVMELAEQNVKKFNYGSVLKLINEDAIQYMHREKISHDFMVVDPEGPKKGADPDLLDKAIYYPMVKAALPYLSAHGIILCHNILLTNPVQEDDYFKAKIAYNNGQFTKFLPLMKDNFAVGTWYDTTEGVGFFGKKI